MVDLIFIVRRMEMQTNLRWSDQKKRERRVDSNRDNNGEVEERVCVGVKEGQRERARRACFSKAQTLWQTTSGWKQLIRDLKIVLKKQQ